MEYNDCIHGRIELPDYIRNIIETPQFQRLKKIQQLGLAYKANPKATCSRYDHCIGTYYLANKTLDALEKNTKNLKIPDYYRKVVTIAALLHDVGHGPFSHSWEYVCDRQYHHEENAGDCIDEIFKVCLIDWDVIRPYAIELIKSLITGESNSIPDKEYLFLSEIVNNKHCSIDVDKWDYLQRDHSLLKDQLNSYANMDFSDVFMNARANDDRTHIEYRYCDFSKIYNIFEIRTLFHINFYQVPLYICLEKILKYIIDRCENYLEQIDGIKLKEIRSEDVNAFLKLNDEEIWRILKKIQSPAEIVELIDCLENVKIAKIYSATDNDKLLVPEYLKVHIKIPYAGEELKSENILFYGNESDKQIFEEKKGFYESTTYFQLKKD